MLRWSLAESAGRFCLPAEFNNVANPDLEKTKNLQNLEHFSLTAPSMIRRTSKYSSVIRVFIKTYKRITNVYQLANYQ